MMNRHTPKASAARLARGILTLTLALGWTVLRAQSPSSAQTYIIDADVSPAAIDSSTLKMGGTDLKGDRIGVNNFYVTYNGKPFIPVMGEFHYVRYPEKYWDQEICKMKAGGINTIATYVFWNIHEETEGKFDWSGNRDLRKFVGLCGRRGMKVVVRIGPFDHGEIRNGGIPDWMLSKPVAIRSNDPGYLRYVRALYHQIGRQLEGLYFKDGGPVIAVQLENEYQHSAAPWGLTYPGQPVDYTVAERDLAATHFGVSVASGHNAHAATGLHHMDTLKAIAREAGIDVPIYTATGWGYAAIIPDETLPVTAAYAYPTWAKEQPSPFYLYKDMHRHPDYAPVRYKPEKYPVFAAELGTGIQITYKRRPTVPPVSIDALVNRCLGSGAGGLGYYMFHGGSTPRGDHYFYSDMAAGCPMISYDFQAPIGEYGQIRPAYQRLKLLNFFVNDFGGLLAPMQTLLPKNNASIRADDTADLRYAVRMKDGRGFVFLNNFQDHVRMPDRGAIRFMIKTSAGDMAIPEKGGFTVAGGENMILPFNLNLDGINLRYATAQLLMKGDDPAHPYYVFFVPGGVRPEFSFAGTTVRRVKNVANSRITRDHLRWLIDCPGKGVSAFTLYAKGKEVRILVTDKAFALKSWRVKINGRTHLAFSDAAVLPDSLNRVELLSDTADFDLYLYPALRNIPEIKTGSVREVKDGGVLAHYRVSLPKVDLHLAAERAGDRRLLVQLPASLPAGLNDIYLDIDYTGDTGMGFLQDQLVTDNFYRGVPWQIGLARFVSRYPGERMSFYFRPLYSDAPYLHDLAGAAVPDFGKNKRYVKINSVRFTPQYKAIISFR